MMETWLLYSSIPPEGTAALPYAPVKQWVEKRFELIVNAVVLNMKPYSHPSLPPSFSSRTIHIHIPMPEKKFWGNKRNRKQEVWRLNLNAFIVFVLRDFPLKMSLWSMLFFYFLVRLLFDSTLSVKSWFLSNNARVYVETVIKHRAWI